jgi:hypothetical protein
MRLGFLNIAAAFACLALACAAPGPEDPTGALGAIAVVRQSATAPPAKAVWVRLYGPTAKGGYLDLWAELSRTSAGYQVSVSKVPVGAYQLHGKAFASSPYDPPTTVADYETTSDPVVQVTAKSTQSVGIVLQQNVARWPPATFSDYAPVVESIVASAYDVDSSDPSVPLTLAATVTDRDGAADVASLGWTATYAPALPAGAAPGGFGSPQAATTTWTPPLGYEGQVTFTIAATDRKGATASLSATVAVSPKNARGAIIVIAQLNNFPDVTRVTATPAQLAPGAVASLAVSAADPDGDALSYAWSDGGCGGTFGTPSAATSSWQAPATAAACTVTVIVRDLDAGQAPKGGQSTGALTLNVRTPATAYAPEFTWAFQSPTGPVPPGARVVFRVEVLEPVGGGASRPVASLAWSDGRGGTFTPLGEPPYDVEWVAPACAALSPPFGVEVAATATGAAPDIGPPGVTTFTFPVTVACP